MNKLKRFTVLLLIISLLVPIVAFAAENVSGVVPGHAYIPKNTIMLGELVNSVDSGKNKVGDKVLFKVVDQIVVNGVVVIPKDTVGEAVVSNVKKAGAFGKGGKIEITAVSVKSLNDMEVPVTLNVDKAGGGQGMLVPILLVGVFSGFVTGKNQTIPAGTKFNVAVASDTDLQISFEKMAELYNKKYPTVQ